MFYCERVRSRHAVTLTHTTHTQSCSPTHFCFHILSTHKSWELTKRELKQILLNKGKGYGKENEEKAAYKRWACITVGQKECRTKLKP